MTGHIGELAALGTAVSWTVAALIMERAVGKVGVMAVNTLKVTFGSVYLALFAFVLSSHAFPSGLAPSAWLFLGASGLVGFVVGDYFLLHAYKLVGARLAMLLMSLSVPLTALGALAVFGEKLGPWSLAGMAACVAGISITVASGGKRAQGGKSEQFDKSAHADAALASRYRKGVAFGVLSALAMAGATLLTKSGAVGVNPVSATQIRIGSALAGFVVFAAVTGKMGEVTAALRNRTWLPLIALGAVFGPFVGVGLLLFAIQHAEAGIVSTLSSLTPVLIIPPSVLFFGRRVGVAEIVGACVAVFGLALLFI